MITDFRIKSGQYAGKWVASAFINGNPNPNTPQIGGSSSSGTDFSEKSMGVIPFCIKYVTLDFKTEKIGRTYGRKNSH